MGKITSNFALVILFCCFFGPSEQRSTYRGKRDANCRKEFLDKTNAAHLGFCWKFNPNRIPVKDAAAACQKIGGHLVTVDTKEKAAALAKFIEDSWLLTNTGYFGSQIGTLYKQMYGRQGFRSLPYTVISGVYTSPDGRNTQWAATGSTVQWGAYGDRNFKRHKPGTHCTHFSHQARMWVFTRSCTNGYKSVCEQGSVIVSAISPQQRPKPVVASRPEPPPTTKPRPTTQQALDPSEYYYYDDYYYYYY